MIISKYVGVFYSGVSTTDSEFVYALTRYRTCTMDLNTDKGAARYQFEERCLTFPPKVTDLLLVARSGGGYIRAETEIIPFKQKSE